MTRELALIAFICLFDGPPTNAMQATKEVFVLIHEKREERKKNAKIREARKEMVSPVNQGEFKRISPIAFESGHLWSPAMRNMMKVSYIAPIVPFNEER